LGRDVELNALVGADLLQVVRERRFSGDGAHCAQDESGGQLSLALLALRSLAHRVSPFRA
jgi:hypothetical protein